MRDGGRRLVVHLACLAVLVGVAGGGYKAGRADGRTGGRTDGEKEEEEEDSFGKEIALIGGGDRARVKCVPPPRTRFQSCTQGWAARLGGLRFTQWIYL